MDRPGKMRIPFEVGALYSRQQHIHAVYGGQERGGISTPANSPLVIAFTGEPGKKHLYPDFRDGEGILHYYGEGQLGDMELSGRNRSLLNHASLGKKLLLFQSLGKSRPYRYLGEFVALSVYDRDGIPDARGNLRRAIVFRLKDVSSESSAEQLDLQSILTSERIGETTKAVLVDARTKQKLFRDRLISVEKGCRLTGIEDLRFLRASHIKPWAECTDAERVDGHNGLLLAAHTDHLFDGGWITFDTAARLIVSASMPSPVEKQLRIEFKRGVPHGKFSPIQQQYMLFHREVVFEKWLRS